MTNPQGALFDPSPYLVPQAGGTPREQLSPDRRRTVRQATQLAAGVHPLTHGPLHKDAAPHDDRQALGARCGSCRFRVPGVYPKCHWPNAGDFHIAVALVRVTHGPATDVRGWWPACSDYQAKP
jgi:hypothetical protein